MKKQTIQTILLGLVLVLTMLAYGLKNNQKFYLEDQYYGQAELEEINIEKLNQLQESKESFGVFVYQPLCSNSESFEKVLKEYQEEKKIKFYKISFSSILESDLKEEIKYYPSFLIFQKGKLINHLKADKDNHKEYYESKEGFEKWLTKYVLLKEITNENVSDKMENIENEQVSKENDENIEEKYIKEIDLNQIKKEKGKVNVYLFWGNGCPHCAEELSFLENMDEKYKNMINLYPFEVWYNEKNAELLDLFAEAKNEKVTGVPYIIIGSKSFKGFGESLKDTLLKTIEEEREKSYDIYLDDIK